MATHHPTAAATRPGALRALHIVAGLLVLLALNQAFLAGRGQFVNRDFLAVHGVLGELIFLMVVVHLVLVLTAGVHGALHRSLLGINLLLLVLVPLQLGLGYAGTTSGEAAAWHLPNGVLIFGLMVTNLWMVRQVRRGV